MMTTHRGVEFLDCRWVETLINHPGFHTVDAQHFIAKGAPASLVEFAENGLLLSMTGEQHDRIRRVLLKAFALRRVDQNRSVMSELARGQDRRLRAPRLVRPRRRVHRAVPDGGAVPADRHPHVGSSPLRRRRSGDAPDGRGADGAGFRADRRRAADHERLRRRSGRATSPRPAGRPAHRHRRGRTHRGQAHHGRARRQHDQRAVRRGRHDPVPARLCAPVGDRTEPLGIAR